MYVIKKISNNTIAASVVRSGTDTIDGSASPYTAIANYMITQTFISNGSAWFAIGQYWDSRYSASRRRFFNFKPYNRSRW